MSEFESALKLENEGKFNEALQKFENCLVLQEVDRGDVYFHSGWCLEQLGEAKFQQAISSYQKAAELTALLVCEMNSNFRCGWLSRYQRNHSEAAGYFERVIFLGDSHGEINTIYHQALFWLAVTRETQGRLIQALQYYRRVQQLTPELAPESRVREIYCLNQLGLYQEAHQKCLSFETQPPANFDENRYRELHSIIQREQLILEKCLIYDDFQI